MNFKHNWQDSNDTKLNIELDGKLLFGQFQDLQSFVFSLKEKPPTHITFDLTNVELIDSSGLGLLIVANDITGSHGQVTLKYPSQKVEQLLHVCQIHEMMEIVL